MRIRFQADADFKHAIIAGVQGRETTMDFRRASDVPLAGLDDSVVLRLAAEDDRVLVSHDVNTMDRHFREFIRTRSSPGLILIPQTRVSVGVAVEGLILLWEVLDSADLEDRVCLFPSLVLC